MKKNWKYIYRAALILILIAISLLIVWPGGAKISVPKPKVAFDKKSPFVHFSTDGKLIDYNKAFPIKKGLDIQGGSHLVYGVDLSKISANDKKNAMDSLQKVIENRVNAFGVSEPQVYTSTVAGESRLAIELAGIKDTDQALSLIGKTAQLEFREVNAAGTGFNTTELTGKDFKHADQGFDPNTNAPLIEIEFNSDGAKKFADITGRNVGKPLAIYLDDKLISAPTVNQQISGGKGQITGKFTVKEAKDLAIQLNAGALPVPIHLIEQRTIGATLGQESINKSFVAGVVGFIFVSIFMVLYYRFLGAFSTIGLGLYLLFMVALIKTFGIVLTMGGIAGLILSVGMSMETDVLVFERIREEMRGGRSFETASSIGFTKAWPSIRDSNAVSLIITAILGYFGTSMIRGFAVILGLGIVVGLLTTFFGTRVLIWLIAHRKFAQNPTLYRVEKEAVHNG